MKEIEKSVREKQIKESKGEEERERKKEKGRKRDKYIHIFNF